MQTQPAHGGTPSGYGHTMDDGARRFNGPRASGVARADRERYTRNWDELLQELRVAQTGVQILTGFLLTVPFSNRFPRLSELQRDTYLGLLVGAIATTALLVAPVAFHRLLFRQRRRPWLVKAANRCALAGLSMLSLISCGAAFLVFDISTSLTAAVIAAAVLLVLFGGLWAAVPLAARYRRAHGSL